MPFDSFWPVRVETASLAGLARTQHGLFRREQAIELGWTRARLHSLVASGWCDHPRRGVYRVVGAPVTKFQLDLAAVWFAGGDAVASHRSGARLWAVPGFWKEGPEVSMARGRSQRREYGLVHGSLLLPAEHRTVVAGIPVTTPARTIFDLAGVVSSGRVERALDDVLARRLCTLGQVQSVFFALAKRGRRGTVVMRALLDARGEGFVAPASELERVARRVFAEAGLPTPAFEVDLGTDDWVGRVDCCWRPQRLIVELDGRRHHSSLIDRASDRRRDNELMAAGWRVLRVTWDDLHQRPAEVVGWIRSALASAA